MTGPRQSREDRSADQLLAGKYVLGLLSDEARREVEARMRRDRGFARIVMEWSRNMAFSLDEGDRRERSAHPAATIPDIPRNQGRRRDLLIMAAWHIWQSATFWRSVALVLFALVLALIAV